MFDFLLFPGHPSADTQEVTYHDIVSIMHIQTSINAREK